METIYLAEIIAGSFIVFVIDVLVIFDIFKIQKKTSNKIIWTILVILWPFIAAALYWFTARKDSKELKDYQPDTPKPVKTDDKPLFQIEKQVGIPEIPDFKDHSQINIRYPLIAPYCHVNIYWDEKESELVYKIEEPQLNEDEKKVLKLLENGIKELINLSFINVNDPDTVLIYLEKNVRVLLTELSIELTKASFLKIMYYIYRDFVGLNELEPLMNDFHIEDIECNGINSPVYIVHRKFRNIRTTLIYNDMRNLASFVEKLAQKCGKYVSYAEPLLDASLPDGSRVNATFTTDVTSRGPSFTIRRFTKTPWSPVQLMQKGSVSAEQLAYIWMLMEYEKSFLVIGGTGSGKCVTGDTPVHFPSGEIIKIKDLIDKKFKKGKIQTDGDWEFVESSGEEILSMSLENLTIVPSKIDKFWRHKAPEKLLKIKTRTGRTVTVTPEHPFFTTKNGNLIKIRADEIKKSSRIAVPMLVNTTNTTVKIDIINGLGDSKNVSVFNENKTISKAVKILMKEKTKKEVSEDYNTNNTTLKSCKSANLIPIKIYKKLLKQLRINPDHNLILKSKIKLPNILSTDLSKFIGLLIGSGHLKKTSCLLINKSIQLRREFLEIGENLFNIKGQFLGNRNKKTVFNSIIICEFLNKIFMIPYGEKAKIIRTPELILKSNNECISKYLQALFDCKASVSKLSIVFSTASRHFACEISTLLLRFGIISSAIKSKNLYRVSISGLCNLLKFYNKIGFTHNEKRNKLISLIEDPLSNTFTSTDLIPELPCLIKEFEIETNLSQNKMADKSGLSGRFIGLCRSDTRKPSINYSLQFLLSAENIGEDTEKSNFIISRIKKLAESDIFWDEVREIKTLKNHKEKYVYDLTVHNNHNFLAGKIPMIVHNTSMINAFAFFIPPQDRVVSIEDTKELQLEHENWLPSVARVGVGLSNLIGQKYGEVSMFDLLKEAFRQRPDYLIVGEIRGKEAFVLMQGISSGHPSYGTMHAESVDTMVRRLQTNPINLSGSLIEGLSAVCVMKQTKVSGKPARKLAKIDEILEVKENLQGSRTNTVSQWDPRTNKFMFNTKSKAFYDIGIQYGMSTEQILTEFKRRTLLLKTLYSRKIFDFKKVQDIINQYYKNPKKVLLNYSIK